MQVLYKLYSTGAMF